jgi:uncharacterized membrane protein YfcA
LDLLPLLAAGLAAVLGGAVNALAGGGTLITFPVLTALGVPLVAANITNTVALCPGYFGATFAQLRDLKGQAARLWLLVPASVLGGLAGGVLLLHTDEKVFSRAVPWLILLAVVLLAAQDRVRGIILARMERTGGRGLPEAWALVPVIPAAVYGGFFGAGVSVIIIAVLGLALSDTLTRLNGLKQALSLANNVAASVFFLFSGQIVWSAALVMAVGALAGGWIGGRLAGRIRPAVLRGLILGIGSGVALAYFLR